MFATNLKLALLVRKIVDVNPQNLTIEVTGGESKVDAMLELLAPIGIVETVRTGLVALSRRKEVVAPAVQQAEVKAEVKKSLAKRVKAAK